MDKYTVAPDAVSDLLNIWLYIAQDNTAAADRLYNKFHKEFQRLGEYPNMGFEQIQFTPAPVRFWPIGNYLVAYRTKKDKIEIIRVMNSARDISAQLQ